MKKRVTVIICTYKGSEYLGRAIRSVLNQTYADIEVIIVDDNGIGTEENIKTKGVVNMFSNQIIYLQHNNNMNGAVARNTGMKKATGDYICFLDDDDLMLPDRIKYCVEKLEENNKYSAVFTDVLCTDERLIPTHFIRVREEGNCYKHILMNSTFFGTGSNLFITRKACESIGLFDEGFLRYQDLEYMLRFYRSYLSTYIPEVCIIKAKNKTNNALRFSKLKPMNEKFVNKFRAEIESLKYEDKIDFYEMQEEILYMSYFSDPKNKITNYKHYKLSKKNVILIIINRSGFSQTAIFSVLNKFRKKIKERKIRKSIPDEVWHFMKVYRGLL